MAQHLDVGSKAHHSLLCVASHVLRDVPDFCLLVKWRKITSSSLNFK